MEEEDNKGKTAVVVDFNNVKQMKDFIENYHQNVLALENALYAILDTDRLDIAKELAAEALDEDLEVYLEEDYAELDFEQEIYLEDDVSLPWDER